MISVADDIDGSPISLYSGVASTDSLELTVCRYIDGEVEWSSSSVFGIHNFATRSAAKGMFCRLLVCHTCNIYELLRFKKLLHFKTLLLSCRCLEFVRESLHEIATCTLLKGVL